MRTFLKPFLEALFRVLFTYDCEGEEFVPKEGPAVVAANHPSYLDPILLSLQVRRPIRFMAWDKLFRIPVVGSLMRAFGAFPVDVRRGQGRSAYLRALELVRRGKVVGLFPEGKRSRMGWMETSLRKGAARLAWETGAPLVPATISGAYRAWPHFQSLPRPARIRVRYHEPIDPKPYQELPEEEAITALLAELRKRVERSLLPGVKRDLRVQVLFRGPSPWPRYHETLPALAFAMLVFWKLRAIGPLLPAYGYLAYLFADHLVIPQTRVVKWFRNASPVLFCLGYVPAVHAALGFSPTPARAALVAITFAAMFPYLYERGRTTMAFIRGLVLACALELGTLFIFPNALGYHAAIPIYAAAFAWQQQTVFSWAAAPTLLAYVALLVSLFKGGVGLLPHATAGLLAWMFIPLLPLDSIPKEAEDIEPSSTLLKLDL